SPALSTARVGRIGRGLFDTVGTLTLGLPRLPMLVLGQAKRRLRPAGPARPSVAAADGREPSGNGVPTDGPPASHEHEAGVDGNGAAPSVIDLRFDPDHALGKSD